MKMREQTTTWGCPECGQVITLALTLGLDRTARRPTVSVDLSEAFMVDIWAHLWAEHGYEGPHADGDDDA